MVLISKRKFKEFKIQRLFLREDFPPDHKVRHWDSGPKPVHASHSASADAPISFSSSQECLWIHMALLLSLNRCQLLRGVLFTVTILMFPEVSTSISILYICRLNSLSVIIRTLLVH